MTAITYQDLCLRSAEAHSAHLEEQLPSIRAAAPRVLAKALLETTRNAMRDACALGASDVRLRLGLVQGAMHSDPVATSRLLNQSSLGLGCKTPFAVFVGKEAAFDPGQAHANFLLESLALAVIWLCEGSDVVMRALLEDQTIINADFLRYPGSINAGTYQRRRPPDHTWNVIDRVLARRGVGSWGESAYLVELGVVPSKTSKSQVPTEERTTFLEEMMGVFRRTGTRNVVLHGRENVHVAAQERLACAFLDVERAKLASKRMAAEGDYPIEIWESEDRRVIRCRHLSNLFGDEAVVAAVADELVGSP
jgi:hypothetical protein